MALWVYIYWVNLRAFRWCSKSVRSEIQYIHEELQIPSSPLLLSDPGISNSAPFTNPPKNLQIPDDRVFSCLVLGLRLWHCCCTFLNMFLLSWSYLDLQSLRKSINDIWPSSCKHQGKVNCMPMQRKSDLEKFEVLFLGTYYFKLGVAMDQEKIFNHFKLASTEAFEGLEGIFWVKRIS